jgi:hypothetical protein
MRLGDTRQRGKFFLSGRICFPAQFARGIEINRRKNRQE